MNNRKICSLVMMLCAGIGLFMSIDSAMAIEVDSPFQQSCDAHKSSKSFTRQAALYCLNQRHGKACHEQAEHYFNQCGYSGSYTAESKRVHAKLFFVAFLTNSSEIGYRKTRDDSTRRYVSRVERGNRS